MALSVTERVRLYRQRHPDRIKETNRKQDVKKRFRTYGITEEQYISLYNAQNGLCAICHRPETMKLRKTLKRLTVDHDHYTGKIRGLLCHACNLGLGHFEDNINYLTSATSYIIRNTQ